MNRLMSMLRGAASRVGAGLGRVFGGGRRAAPPERASRGPS